MKRFALSTTVLVLALITLAAPLAAQQDIPEPDPQAVLKGIMANPRLRNEGTGEGFCWHAASGANVFLDAYEAFGNPEWLAAAEQYYDWYLSKAQKDPDGRLGWIGDPIGQRGSKLQTDAVVGDAILCEPLVRFAEIVLKHEPQKLASRFGAKARKYVEIATEICWTKWNARGCYYEDKAGWGSYHTYGKLIDPKTNQWVDTPSRVISNNLNKHYSVSRVLLRLWRITGKKEYRERCLKVFGRAKRMWRYYPDEDRVVWNFWMPHGPYDLEGRAPKSWVAVHPNRAGYQSGEVADWVEVYDSGLVFSREDLERIIRTNHWMIATGSWRNADGTSKAGTLWSALARFDKQIADRALEGVRGKTDPRSRIRLAYLQNVVLADNDDPWRRRLVPRGAEVEVVDVPLQPGRNIAMSVVIPNAVDIVNDDRVQLACQTRAAGTLQIELLDAESGKVLGSLASIEVPESSTYNAPMWDGTNPATGKQATGKFMVRWSLAGESRVEPVWVIRGERRSGQSGPRELARGQSVSEDFEGRLDSRWQLEGSEPSTEQAHGGRKSLKVTRTARLVFGRHDDLPVRVTMWVYDTGKSFGKKSGNGPGWGIVTAMGDTFAVRQCWRPYLAGDREYAWFNTGENQWFSPHRTRVPRGKGWVEWVFDFSDPSKVTVTGDGKPVAGLGGDYTPKGGAAVFLSNGSMNGPLYVDDIKVEYPR